MLVWCSQTSGAASPSPVWNSWSLRQVPAPMVAALPLLLPFQERAAVLIRWGSDWLWQVFLCSRSKLSDDAALPCTPHKPQRAVQSTATVPSPEPPAHRMLPCLQAPACVRAACLPAGATSEEERLDWA